MKEKVLISVDSGKFATKALLYSKDKQVISIFRSKMQEVEELGVEIQPNSFYIQHQKRSYLVGDMVSENYNNFDLTKTINLHKICIYTAISDLLEHANLNPANIDIRLAVNIPINAYKDAKAKQEYKEFIENNGEPVSLTYNGKQIMFYLKDIVIAFEGMGIIYDELEATKDSYTVVIDVGGLNTTYCTFSGIHPIFDTMTNYNSGINMLKGKIGKLINERYGVVVSANDLRE